MANLTAKFKLIDEMSDRMEAIADSGHSLLSSWEQMGGTANSSFGTAAAAADGVATSFNGVGNSATEAAQATDQWTSAVGNYDKGALEAIYSTEELVEMGLKSADALAEQDAMFELCEKSAAQLTQSIEAATNIENELSEAQERAAETAEAVAEADGISTEAKEALTRAQEEATESMEELQRAQENAASAMENYDAVLTSGTTDLDELEAAAERAGHAAEELAEANEKASKATEELSKATDKAGEELENTGKGGVESINGIASALTAAGITKMLHDIAEAAYELADAFSDAEKTVVLATGATGEALEDLENSMMSVYSKAKSADLSSTAGAVGEINTRLGLTGEKLEYVTELFLDYSNVTGQKVVPSVQSVTKIMNQWDVELERLPELLDELTYAGQISGINVANLSDTLVTNKGVLQQLGFTLEDSIGLFAQLELQGVSAQTAMTGFRTALNKFADEGKDAETALSELIDEIVNAGSESEATAIAVDYFGSRAGAALASSIRNGNLSIEDLTATLNGAEGALETTATASQTLSEKWQSASNSIKSAFTKAIEPTLNKISSGFADMTKAIGTYLDKHPWITKILTAIGVGLGAVAIGIVGVSVASLSAIPAVAALGAAVNAAIWPITLIAAGVAAVTAAVLFLSDAFSDANSETEGLTAVSKEQYYAIQDLNAEYEVACEKYGENSEEASRLRYQIDDLTEAYEASKQTLEEFEAEVDDICKSVSELSNSFSDSMQEIKANELGDLALIQKFADLSEQGKLTGAQQKELEAITKHLVDTYSNITSPINDATVSTEEYVEALKNACEYEAEKRRQEEAQETYIEALKKRAELTKEIEKAEANLRLSQESDANAAFLSDAWFYNATGWLGAWATDTNEYKDALDELNASMQETENVIAEIEQGWGDVVDAENDTRTEAERVSDTVDSICESMTAELNELAEAYNEAYEAAKESFDGQFGLFDEAQANMDSTVANAQKALDSQLAYWDNYLNNVNILKETSAADLGITQENYNALMAYVQDGSAEAAGLAQSMVAAIQSGNSEAITTLANTIGEVQAKRDEAAGAVAEWQTDFNNKMKEIVTTAEQAVEDMDLGEEATAAASATMNAYASAILSHGEAAVTNAQSIANRVKSALASANVSVSMPDGYAEGTDYATPGPHLVGENGPEIVEFRGGEKVYTNDETERIMARSAAVKFFSSPEGGTAIQENAKANPNDNKKTIRLEINGGGSIEVNGSTDESAVVEILQAHLKPVLASIVKQEIYEEGEQSYDF